MPEIEQARRERLQAAVAALDADAALITSPPNVRYLTGLASSNAAVLVPAVGPGPCWPPTSGMRSAARRDCPDLELLTERLIEPALARLAAARGWAGLAFEAQEMTVERHLAFAAAAADGGAVRTWCRWAAPSSSCGWSRTRPRSRCSPGPARSPRAAFEDLLARSAPGHDRARAGRACWSGPWPNSARSGPPSRPSSPAGRTARSRTMPPATGAVEPGDMITIDCGARYGGYHADMTRTVVLGEPADWQREIYDLVAAAQRAGIDAAVPGADVARVDAAARGPDRRRPVTAEHFGHGLGHGVGLEVHEAPIMGYGQDGYTRGPGPHHRRARDLPARARAASGSRTPWWCAPAAGTAAPQELLTTTTRELLVL